MFYIVIIDVHMNIWRIQVVGILGQIWIDVLSATQNNNINDDMKNKQYPYKV